MISVVVLSVALPRQRRPQGGCPVAGEKILWTLERLFVSMASLAEIRFGIEMVPDAIRRAELNDWLTNRVRPMFGPRVLPVSEDVMFKWRLLVEQGRKMGHTFTPPDLIIAATGLQHGLTVVTRDTTDYQRTRVALFNPWVDALVP